MRRKNSVRLLDKKFNNTRTNLRICSHRENSINASLNKKNTSGVIVVAWKKDKKKWKAYISTNYKQIHLGYFEDKNSAILARLNAEKEYFIHLLSCFLNGDTPRIADVDWNKIYKLDTRT